MQYSLSIILNSIRTIGQSSYSWLEFDIFQQKGHHWSSFFVVLRNNVPLVLFWQPVLRQRFSARLFFKSNKKKVVVGPFFKQKLFFEAPIHTAQNWSKIQPACFLDNRQKLLHNNNKVCAFAFPDPCWQQTFVSFSSLFRPI